MTSPIGTLLTKCIALALCAWGIVVILQICAVALAAVLGNDPHAAGPALGTAMAATWALVTAQLCGALLGGGATAASDEG